ncbi:S41 family peptidase [Flavobacteriaceae bacterium F08102]|nr:S41 family peptidase [Flavobacteriaceae bacterium F08102]
MMKNKLYLPLFIALAIVLGIFIGSFLNYPQGSPMGLFKGSPQEAKIKRLINYIQYDYVDDVDTDSLLDGTIANLLSKLDPHSVYIPASEHDAVAERMNGQFVGVGVQFRMVNDSLTVIKVVEGGPSEKAGIKDGDRILIADGDTLYGKGVSTDYIMKTLKGKAKTNVDLTIFRKATGEMLDIRVKRGNIPDKSLLAAYMLNDSLGYIKLDRFASTTYDEFITALHQLQEKNMKDLVLDLRGNGGGYMGVATQIVDEFLEKDKLIVFTKNKGGQIDKTYATAKGDFEKGKIYVLIDENSASASEIVAGALQDNDKGTIVGRRSFGKGLVQQEMELGDGSSVRLTVARYYTPTGRSIQKPYKGKDGKSYYQDLHLLRFKNGELMNGDSIKVNDSLRFTTPKGKVVYGGGGIVPDVFVSIDTSSYFGIYHIEILNDFVFNYVDTNREEVHSWKWEEFVRDFDKNDEIFNHYNQVFKNKIENASHGKIKGEISERSKPYLKLYLKALFAQMVFDDSSFYKIINEKDKMIERVLELEAEVNYIKH